jgi:hypothetical protein
MYSVLNPINHGIEFWASRIEGKPRFLAMDSVVACGSLVGSGQLPDVRDAAEWQEKANKLFTDPEDRKKGEDLIKLYRNEKPYRESN